ncbi:L-arabinose-responsive transcription regulator ARA1 [Colletotrichum trifolii]|uniref:L-arabinose-responsive transcription regulator ARA1 n=1 Tax=Colletotrichum trifolii TaxID=5466 RepID=A0A4R8R5W9_COLTR|nr:L-arabinose-responsive transcription regulator ARA1 [Colletotrichum trifolii]
MAHRHPPEDVQRKRTRTGCKQCREARKKCCEQKPTCGRCSTRHLECVYDEFEARRNTSNQGLRDARRKPRKQQQRPEDEFMQTFEVASSAAEPSNKGSSEQRATEPSHTTADCSHMMMDMSVDVCFEPEEKQTMSDMPPPPAAQFDDSLPLFSSSNFTDATSLSLELPLPLFSDFTDDGSTRKLLHHFCEVLSSRVVFAEQPHSSFRSLVLPLAYDNSPVLFGICAFAGGHLEHMGVQDMRHSSEYRVLAAKRAFDLVQWKCHHEQTLATIMMLVYYESLTLDITSDMVLGHMRAVFLILSSVSAHEKSPSMQFLEKSFQYYDVITALSLGISPISATPVPDYIYPLAVVPPPASTRTPSFDPFLGMSGDLWPIIYRLSLVKSLKEELEAAVNAGHNAKAAVLRVEFESMTQAIDKALQEWEPPVQPTKIAALGTQDGVPQLQAMVQNSLAYRHSALIYLHRFIYSHRGGHPEIQKHCRASLERCAEVVASGGSKYALLWPLSVAACEAETYESRERARFLFARLQARQGMANIQRGLDGVLECWNTAGLGPGYVVQDDAWVLGLETRKALVILG